MKHDRAYHKFKDKIKRDRKIQIVKHWGKHWESNLENPRYIGKLVKGKIHCSCPMCSVKTHKDGPRISELRRLKEFDE